MDCFTVAIHHHHYHDANKKRGDEIVAISLPKIGAYKSDIADCRKFFNWSSSHFGNTRHDNRQIITPAYSLPTNYSLTNITT